MSHRPYDDRLRSRTRSYPLLDKERHQIHIMFLLLLHRLARPWSVLPCFLLFFLFLIVLSQHILPIPPSLPFVLISQSCPFAIISAVLTVWMMVLIMSHTLSRFKIRHYSILVLALQYPFARRNMFFTVLLYSPSPPCYQPPSQANATTVQYHPSSPIHGILALSGNGGAVASLRRGIRMLWRGRVMKKVGLRVF